MIERFSLFAGHTYQYPAYESILAGGIFTCAGMLRYYRDDRGRSWIERGADEIRGSRRRTAVLALSFVGFANVCMAGYNVGINWFALYADAGPAYPSYLRNDLCGVGTDYPCPGKDVPIFTTRSFGPSSESRDRLDLGGERRSSSPHRFAGTGQRSLAGPQRPLVR